MSASPAHRSSTSRIRTQSWRVTVDLTDWRHGRGAVDFGTHPDYGGQCDLCRHEVRAAARRYLLRESGPYRSRRSTSTRRPVWRTYDITVGLQGTMSNLKPTYRSEPPLSETDIFALLALGRTQEEAQLYQEQQVQQGADPDHQRAAGRRAECHRQQPHRQAVWRRHGEDRSGVCRHAGQLQRAHYGAEAALATADRYLRDQRKLHRAAAAARRSTTLRRMSRWWWRGTRSGVFSVVYKIRRRYR